ncbi:MAG TPA: DUF4232 domain-containing protein [Actinomycetota bacterium]|nr:DUF4232 domain-containing protein [Actinomycetota bacterium]
MADLRSAFDRLDEMPVPDLRDDIARRAAREPRVAGATPVRTRLVAALVALGVFAGGAVLAVKAFAPQHRTPGGAAETVYRDRDGWSIHVPRGWRALPFEILDPSDASIRYRGVQLSNVALSVPRLARGTVPLPDRGSFPPNGIAVIVARTSGIPGGDEVPLPLSLDELTTAGAASGASTASVAYFSAGGWTFAASATFGADAPAGARRLVDRTLASFDPPPALGGSCPASDLTGRVVTTEGAAGTQFVTIGLANRSSATCHLEGAPSVEALDPSGSPLPVEVRAGLPEGPALQPSTVTLRSGDEASLVVAFSDVTAGSRPCLHLGGVRVAVPGSSGSVEVPMEPAGQLCAGILWVAPLAASTAAG